MNAALAFHYQSLNSWRGAGKLAIVDSPRSNSARRLANDLTSHEPAAAEPGCPRLGSRYVFFPLNSSLAGVFSATLVSFTTSLFAQSTSPTVNSPTVNSASVDPAPVVLSPFTVSTERDTRLYRDPTRSPRGDQQ
jgi:hypothetical protein